MAPFPKVLITLRVTTCHHAESDEYIAIEPFMKIGNLFAAGPGQLPQEWLEVLWRTQGVRVERIVSRRHATPPDVWFDQENDEWVALLSGSAGLRVEGRPELLILKPGDYVLLPAHLRHRVDWTDNDRDTVWLAVHASSTTTER